MSFKGTLFRKNTQAENPSNQGLNIHGLMGFLFS